jgi:hypothetical protein
VTHELGAHLGPGRGDAICVLKDAVFVWFDDGRRTQLSLIGDSGHLCPRWRASRTTRRARSGVTITSGGRRPAGVVAPTAQRYAGGMLGGMFWFSAKTLSGSYLAFSATSRLKFSSP